MAKHKKQDQDYSGPLKRLLGGILCVALFVVFLVWRIDSPRVERFRANLIDRVVPSFDWALVPVTKAVGMVEDFQSYQRIYEQNQELRRELRQMKAWKEAALQLEQENAQLLNLNNVRLDAQLSFVTGVVLADSGSPFRQSVLLNIGTRDGIVDGWAATDGLGLVGRISGVGSQTSRVVLLTDSNSAIPITVQPSGQTALLVGDNTAAPPIQFLEAPDKVRPGDRVISSGDGGVFPAGLLVGHVAMGADRRLRVRLTADYERLEFLRVLRSHSGARVIDPSALVVTRPTLPETPSTRPDPEDTPTPEAQDQ